MIDPPLVVTRDFFAGDMEPGAKKARASLDAGVGPLLVRSPVFTGFRPNGSWLTERLPLAPHRALRKIPLSSGGVGRGRRSRDTAWPREMSPAFWSDR